MATSFRAFCEGFRAGQRIIGDHVPLRISIGIASAIYRREERRACLGFNSGACRHPNRQRLGFEA
jgi:hypothetical protein